VPVPEPLHSPSSVIGSETALAFREVRVFEVREVLRLWLRGEGIRAIERLGGVDRKTARRYVDAAVGLGLARDGGEAQLDDGFLGSVLETVRPHRVDGHGQAWRTLAANDAQVRAWLEEGLTAVKVHELLVRRGVAVPKRTVQRYAMEVCGHGRGRAVTVRVADGDPGDEVQIDFGRMGLVHDAESGRRRVCHALIFTACYSRHCFVWLTFNQTTAATIEGCEAAWGFFAGVFRTVIPDNMSAIVDKANPLEPRLNQAFVEYAQARGFAIDPARVRSPQDNHEGSVIPRTSGGGSIGAVRVAIPRDNYVSPASWRIRSSSPFQMGAGSSVVLPAFWIASRTI
jgi:transposase